MYFASWRMRPSEPVLETRSEPAKSTRCSFDLYIENHNHLGLFVSTDSVVGMHLRMTSEPGCLVIMVMVKIECEREELWFIAVSATFLQADPCT